MSFVDDIMCGTEVTIKDMMACREQRVSVQNILLKKHPVPVISFCMNIPGPVKTTPLIRAGFEQGKEALLSALSTHNITVLDSFQFHKPTGDELFLSVSAPAERLKKITCSIEERHPLGRLFDMDIIQTDGTKVCRSIFRKCLICGRQAQDCARSRRHTVFELQNKICQLLSSELPLI